MRPRVHLAVRGLLALFAGAASSLAAGVETYLVVDSRGAASSAMPRGTLLARGSPFELPTDAVVILLADTGELLTVHGPTSSIPRLDSGSPPKRAALKAVADVLLAQRSGRPMAIPVRGSDEKPASDSSVVDITSSGRKCVFEGLPSSLWRSGSLPALRVSLEAVRGGEKQFFDWPSGSATHPWPDGVPRRAGETYLLSAGTASARRFDLAVAEGEPSPGSALLFMAESGCNEQLVLALKEISESK